MPDFAAVSLAAHIRVVKLVYSASTKNYRPTKIIWTIHLVMHYRPITENNCSEINFRFLPFPVGNCCWVFFVCLSRFGTSAVLNQIVQIHCVPKMCPNTHTALMDSNQSSQKATESAHGLQNSEGISRISTRKPVRILRKS